MTLDLRNILVVDVEATCWESKIPPEGEESEIIQIGACLLNVENIKVTERWLFYVKPIKSKVSKFCEELTGITQTVLDEQGKNYAEITQILITLLKSKRRPWASYGAFDRFIFEKMSKMHNIIYPFGTNHINIKNLVALKFKWKKEKGMIATLDFFNMPFIGVHHNASDDAYNAALILIKALWIST